MKNILLIGMIAMTMLACEKTPITNGAPWRGLLGEWTYREYYVSPGGGGSWYEVTPSNQKIEFAVNGNFVPAPSFMPEFNHFEYLDSVTIQFSNTITNIAGRQMRVSISEDGATLYLSPWNPICIEGCSNKFTRNNIP